MPDDRQDLGNPSAARLGLDERAALLTGQKRVLEMVATGAPLADTLAELTRFIEAQEKALRCGILIVADDGEHFRRGSGPNLPEAYHCALDGVPITPPYLGPCGQAAHQGSAVVVTDIAGDARWADVWRDLVLSCGLAACRSTPVFASDGRVLASFAMYYDRPRDPHPAHPELIEIATHLAGVALERTQAEAALRESERRSRELLDALPAAVYTTDAAGRITFFNRAAVDLSGRRPELGSDEWCVTWRLYRPDGTMLPRDECPMAVALKEDRPIRGAEAIAERPDGTRVPFIPYPTPLHDSSGKLVGAVNMLVDITERKADEQRLKLLAREVDHRAKNILAIVLAMVRMTRADGIPAFKDAVEARVAALARAHTLLSDNRWDGADLKRLVEEELAPYRRPEAPRVRLGGPSLMLTPAAAQSIAMTLHELATNAVKHGALAAAAGQVSVEWSRRADERLALRWAEADGPSVEQPSRRGFGTSVIERTIRDQLGGAVRFDWRAEGLVCEIDLPADTTAPRARTVA